jgi:hypothetical protein
MTGVAATGRLPSETRAERGGFEPPEPLAEFNGLANREQNSATPNPAKSLRFASLPLTAQGQRATSNPPDLARVIDAWPALPNPIKAAVLALVNAAAILPTARAGVSLSKPRNP